MRGPGEEPFRGEGGRIVLRRIQHHLDHTLDVTIDRGKRTDLHPEAPGNGGAHLCEPACKIDPVAG